MPLIMASQIEGFKGAAGTAPNTSQPANVRTYSTSEDCTQALTQSLSSCEKLNSQTSNPT